MATLTATKPVKHSRLPYFASDEHDECPICKAAGYRLRPDVEEAIERSMRGEGRVAFNSLEEMFADLDAQPC